MRWQSCGESCKDLSLWVTTQGTMIFWPLSQIPICWKGPFRMNPMNPRSHRTSMCATATASPCDKGTDSGCSEKSSPHWESTHVSQNGRKKRKKWTKIWTILNQNRSFSFAQLHLGLKTPEFRELGKASHQSLKSAVSMAASLSPSPWQTAQVTK